MYKTCWSICIVWLRQMRLGPHLSVHYPHCYSWSVQAVSPWMLKAAVSEYTVMSTCETTPKRLAPQLPAYFLACFERLIVGGHLPYMRARVGHDFAMPPSSHNLVFSRQNRTSRRNGCDVLPKRRVHYVSAVFRCTVGLPALSATSTRDLLAGLRWPRRSHNHDKRLCAM